MSDELHIEREITLEADLEEVWPLVASADGWQLWLVDTADVEVAEGAEGEVADDGVLRRVRVTQVGDSQVTFRWWEYDDASSVSEVVIRVEPLQLGGSRLLISERLMVATTQAATGRAWDARTCVLSLQLLMLVRA